MGQIIAFSGKKQSGKSTCGSFVLGMALAKARCYSSI